MSLQEEIAQTTRDILIAQRTEERERLQSAIAVTQSTAAETRDRYAAQLTAQARAARTIDVPILSQNPRFLATALPVPMTRSSPISGSPPDPSAYQIPYGVGGGGITGGEYRSHTLQFDRDLFRRQEAAAIDRYLAADPSDLLGNAIALSPTGQPRVGAQINEIREQHNASANAAVRNPLPVAAYNSPLARPPEPPARINIPLIADYPTHTRRSDGQLSEEEQRWIAERVTGGGIGGGLRQVGGRFAAPILAQGGRFAGAVGRRAVAIGGGAAGVWSWVSGEQQRITGIANLIVNLHNGAIASTDFLRSLDTIIAASAKLVGAKTKDNPVTGFIEDKLKEIFGKNNVDVAKIKWLQFSTVYRAGANIFNRTRQHFAATNNAIERIAENQNAVNNSLVTEGIISGDNYHVQPERVDIPERIGVAGKLQEVIRAAPTVANELAATAQELVGLKEQLDQLDKQRIEIEEKNKAEAEKAKLKLSPNPANQHQIDGIDPTKI